ncbi:hypothetical protein LguiA_025928 [Lonicera macranthoides]
MIKTYKLSQGVITILYNWTWLTVARNSRMFKPAKTSIVSIESEFGSVPLSTILQVGLRGLKCDVLAVRTRDGTMKARGRILKCVVVRGDTNTSIKALKERLDELTRR